MPDNIYSPSINTIHYYFDYDSKKSGSLTLSHLRSSFMPISAPFNARVVDLVVCNNQRFIEKYDLTACLKENGTIRYKIQADDKNIKYKELISEKKSLTISSSKPLLPKCSIFITSSFVLTIIYTSSLYLIV